MTRLMRFGSAAALVLAVVALEAQGQEAPPPSADVSYDQGLKLYRQRNFRAAAQEFEKVTQLDPARAEAHYLKGYCQYMLRDHVQAVESFGMAFRANPAFDPRTIFRPHPPSPSGPPT
jgi:Flp pilus assembly protein TadD